MIRLSPAGVIEAWPPADSLQGGRRKQTYYTLRPGNRTPRHGSIFNGIIYRMCSSNILEVFELNQYTVHRVKLPSESKRIGRF